MAVTPNKGYELQTTGSNVGTWGSELNNNVFGLIDTNLGGITSVGLTSSNVTLTSTQAQNACIRLTGALTANVTVTTPGVGFFYVENTTTGNFSVTISNGVGSTYIPPQYAFRTVFCDATYGVRAIGLPPPGQIIPYAVNIASFPPWLTGELIAPYGQAVPRTGSTARLFALLGTSYGGGDGSTTFNLPDLRGRAPICIDNLGGSAAGRITSISGITGTTLGSGGGAQTHTLSSTEMPAHAHGVNDPSHAHTTPYVYNATSFTGPGAGFAYYPGTSTTTSAAYTGISIQSAGGGAAHNNVQPSIILNYLMTL